jgi:hypothetical protein
MIKMSFDKERTFIYSVVRHYTNGDTNGKRIDINEHEYNKIMDNVKLTGCYRTKKLMHIGFYGKYKVFTNQFGFCTEFEATVSMVKDIQTMETLFAEIVIDY